MSSISMVSKNSMKGIASPSSTESDGVLNVNDILYKVEEKYAPQKIDFKNLDRDTKNILNNSISPPPLIPSVYPDGTLTAADSQAYQAGLRKKNLEKQKILNILKIVFIIGLIIGIIIGSLALLEHFDVLNVGLIPDKKSTFINTCMSAIK